MSDETKRNDQNQAAGQLDEQYLDPDISGLDKPTQQMMEEIWRLRSSARHFRGKWVEEKKRSDELQRRLNEKLANESADAIQTKHNGRGSRPQDVHDAKELTEARP